MFGLSPIHLIFLAVIVLILFGRGKISEFMGDFGKGIKSFKQGMNEDDVTQPTSPVPPAQITSASPAAPPVTDSEKAPDPSNVSNP